MPRNTREWSKRKASEAQNNLRWAFDHLGDVKVKYNDHHPEIAGLYGKIQDMLVETWVAIEAVKSIY